MVLCCRSADLGCLRCHSHLRNPVPVLPPPWTHRVPMMPHIAQVSRYAAVRPSYQAVTFGIPLVDEKIVDPILGRPRHIFTFEIAGPLRRNEHLGLLKSHFAKAFHKLDISTCIICNPQHRGTSASRSCRCAATGRRYYTFSHNGDRRSNTWQQPAPVSRRPYLTWV